MSVLAHAVSVVLTDYVGKLVWLHVGIHSSTLYERGSWHPPVQYTYICHFVQLKAKCSVLCCFVWRLFGPHHDLGVF